MVASGCVENAEILLEPAALGVDFLLRCGERLLQHAQTAS